MMGGKYTEYRRKWGWQNMWCVFEQVKTGVRPVLDWGKFHKHGLANGFCTVGKLLFASTICVIAISNKNQKSFKLKKSLNQNQVFTCHTGLCLQVKTCKGSLMPSQILPCMGALITFCMKLTCKPFASQFSLASTRKSCRFSPLGIVRLHLIPWQQSSQVSRVKNCGSPVQVSCQ